MFLTPEMSLKRSKIVGPAPYLFTGRNRSLNFYIFLKIYNNSMQNLIVGLIVTNAVLSIAFAAFFMDAHRALKLKKLIEKTQASKIGSLAIGFSEVLGEAIPARGSLLRSPFSNKECIYYKCVVEKYRKSAKASRGTWDIIKIEENGLKFFLKDDTGLVLVDPKEADVNLVPCFEVQSDSLNNPPEQIKQFLARNGVSATGFLGIDAGHRFREFVIAPKDRLFVLGTAERTNEGAIENGETLMMHKGEKEKIFYISDKQEKDILKELNNKILQQLFVCGLLIVAFLYEIYYLKNPPTHVAPVY